MNELPTLQASCDLDEAGVRAQAGRYRAIGAGAELLAREPGRLLSRLRVGVEPALVEEAIAIERECCPFFDIGWDPETRRLRFSVSRGEDDPAIDAVAHALGLEERRIAG